MANRNETEWIARNTNTHECNVWGEWVIKMRTQWKMLFGQCERRCEWESERVRKKNHQYQPKMLMNWFKLRWFITHYVTSAFCFCSECICTYVCQSDDLLQFELLFGSRHSSFGSIIFTCLSMLWYDFCTSSISASRKWRRRRNSMLSITNIHIKYLKWTQLTWNLKQKSFLIVLCLPYGFPLLFLRFVCVCVCLCVNLACVHCTHTYDACLFANSPMLYVCVFVLRLRVCFYPSLIYTYNVLRCCLKSSLMAC